MAMYFTMNYKKSYHLKKMKADFRIFKNNKSEMEGDIVRHQSGTSNQ